MRQLDRHSRFVVPLCSFALATAWLLTRVDDFDIWFHLLIGKEIFRTGRIPAADFYVYPALGAASGFHEWGFDVVAFLSHRVGGLLGLAVLNAALGAGALVLVALAAVRRGASWWSCALLLGPVAFFCSFRFCYRPESALYLAMGATLYCLERRWLAVLPLLTAVEALFHPSPLILLLIVGCYALDLVWEARADRNRIALVAASVVVSVLAPAIVPYGLHQLTLPIEFVARGDLTRGITEFWPTLSTARWWHLALLVPASAAGLAFVPRRRISDALLLAGFGYLAYAHVRNVPLLALVALGPVATALERLVQGMRPSARAALVGLELCAASVVFLVSPQWGVGEKPDHFPELAVQFIRDFHPAGRIVNALHEGGYLAWNLYPSYLVSCDGRTYYGENEPMRFSESVLEARQGWREAARGVSMIATSAVRISSGELIPVLAELDADPDWALVTMEPAGLLFVRRSALPAAAQPLDKGDIWRQVLAETDAAFRSEGVTRAWKAHFARAVALFKLHDFASAKRSLDEYLRLAPEDLNVAPLARLLGASMAGNPEAQAAVEEMYRRGRGL